MVGWKDTCRSLRRAPQIDRTRPRCDDRLNLPLRLANMGCLSMMRSALSTSPRTSSVSSAENISTYRRRFASATRSASCSPASRTPTVAARSARSQTSRSSSRGSMTFEPPPRESARTRRRKRSPAAIARRRRHSLKIGTTATIVTEAAATAAAITPSAQIACQFTAVISIRRHLQRYSARWPSCRCSPARRRSARWRSHPRARVQSPDVLGRASSCS